MSGWDIYEARMSTKRQMWVDRSRASFGRRLLDSPSCHVVRVNGVEQTLSITHRTTHTEKRVCAMPGEELKHGGLVEYNDSVWLITEVDTDNEIYQRGLMKRCNHVLRWISKDGKLKEKWCIVEDGTKYLIGEKSEEHITIGDARIAVTIGKDEDSIELDRGLRFLIDDEDIAHPTAYQITKANRFFNMTHGEGVFRFILNEVVLTDHDNIKHRIADYSNWLPPRELDGDHVDSEYTVVELVSEAKKKTEESPPEDTKKGWL